MGKVFFARGRGRPMLHDYEPQHAWGVASPNTINAWLGIDGEKVSFVAKFLPTKCVINSLSAKFTLADSKRKMGSLP